LLQLLRDKSDLIYRVAPLVEAILSGVILIAMLSLEQTQRATGLTRPEEWRLLALTACGIVAWPLAVGQLGLNESQRRRPLTDVLFRLALATGISIAVVTVAAFLTAAPIARRLPLMFGVSQFVTLGLLRLLTLASLHAIRRAGRNFRDVLIVGTGPRAARLHRAIAQQADWGLRVAGFVDDRDVAVDPSLSDEPVHKLTEIHEILRDEIVDEVILACPLSMLSVFAPLVRVCAEAGVPVTLPSDLFGEDLPPPRVSNLGSVSALSFAPVHHSRTQLVVKRAVDLLGAFLLLVLTSPVMAVAALSVRATSPGPILFRQKRSGMYGRTFEFIKFRSMYADAEEQRQRLQRLNEMDGPVFKIKHDPRITPAGRILRKWSIDELPQLWHVLRGEMSLVGPRPPLPGEVEKYATFERRRLSMRPGITCLWQVSGRNEIGFDNWVKLDLEYIDSWSLLRDVEILVKTIPAVLKGSGQ
jgi:exopolysaccharide biosynthesis polyprenyl glycosylphosphotransferase